MKYRSSFVILFVLVANLSVNSETTLNITSNLIGAELYLLDVDTGGSEFLGKAPMSKKISDGRSFRIRGEYVDFFYYEADSGLLISREGEIVSVNLKLKRSGEESVLVFDDYFPEIISINNHIFSSVFRKEMKVPSGCINLEFPGYYPVAFSVESGMVYRIYKTGRLNSGNVSGDVELPFPVSIERRKKRPGFFSTDRVFPVLISGFLGGGAAVAWFYLQSDSVIENGRLILGTAVAVPALTTYLIDSFLHPEYRWVDAEPEKTESVSVSDSLRIKGCDASVAGVNLIIVDERGIEELIILRSR